MTVAETGSRVNDAYEWILAEITDFRFAAGSPLSENKIASKLGISRTPIREALQRLEKEGLVRRTSNARFAVARPSMREIEEACDMLQALDIFMFAKAAERMQPGDSVALIEFAHAMAFAARSGDLTAWAEADAAYHALVNRLADNSLIAETLRQCRQRVQRFWLRAASRQSRLESCSAEHLALADAVARSDRTAIEIAVIDHISHMRASILDMLSAATSMFGDESSDE